MPIYPFLTAHLRVSQIHPNPEQARKLFDPEAQSQLEQSLREQGLINPISVVQEGPESYRIIAGERRFRAACSIGWSEIDARVWPVNSPTSELDILSLIENLQRTDLTPLEEAKGYQLLAQKNGWSQEKIASSVGKSQPMIAQTLRILDEPREIQDLINTSALPKSYLQFLDKVLDPQERAQWATKVVEGGWSRAELQKRLKPAAGPEATSPNVLSEEDPLKGCWPFDNTAGVTWDVKFLGKKKWQLTVSAPDAGTPEEMHERLTQWLTAVSAYLKKPGDNA